MNMTARRLRSMGWIATLVVCAALVMVLAFCVNGLRSKVQKSSAQIVALKQETMYLETEFETRANQQQLKAWNDVEFGYTAPSASQYLDNERQLASYAKPIEPDAPAPVRVASADDEVAAAAAFPAMVSPMTGKAAAKSGPSETASEAKNGDAPAAAAKHHANKAKSADAGSGLASLGDRLGTVHHAAAAATAHKTAPTRVAKPKDAKAPKPKMARAKPATVAKSRLASSARSHDHDTDAPRIRLALRDAKAVK